MKKAFGYCRVSSIGQTKGDGIARQEEAIRQYAKANRIQIVEVFQDEGVSGTTELDERDGLTNLLAAIESNGVRTVIVERSDRLARSLMVNETIINDFRTRGITVLDTSGNDLTADDQDDLERTMIRQMLAVIAQYEKTKLVVRMRSARTKIRKSGGRCEGRKPYGEKPGEAEVLAQMKTFRKQGRSWQYIADELNRLGHKTRKGTSWQRSHVHAILGE